MSSLHLTISQNATLCIKTVPPHATLILPVQEDTEMAEQQLDGDTIEPAVKQESQGEPLRCLPCRPSVLQLRH